MGTPAIGQKLIPPFRSHRVNALYTAKDRPKAVCNA
jgi:hypothetical protein